MNHLSKGDPWDGVPSGLTAWRAFLIPKPDPEPDRPPDWPPDEEPPLPNPEPEPMPGPRLGSAA